MKVLAIKWRRLGDTVLWTAALEALKAHFPVDTELDIALAKPYASLFAGDARFTRVFPLSSGTGKFLQTVRELRARRYEYILNFHASDRSALLSVVSGGRQRVIHHHSRHGKTLFSHRAVPNLGKPMSAIERDLNVVRALGWDGPSPATKIHAADGDVRRARERLHAAGWQNEPLVLLSVGASRPAKQWPLERYVQLAERLSQRSRVGLVFDSDSAFAGDTYHRDRLRKLCLWLPTPNLGELVGCLTHACAYVGSDSGVKHLACALGIPTVTLFGPESLGEWHGYPLHKNPVIQKAVVCRDRDPEPPSFAWCGVPLCPYGSHACMNLITPPEVAEAVERILELRSGLC